MKRENVIAEKSMAFAVRIVKLSRYLRNEKQEYELGRQIMRSGTSIGANVHEAIHGQSRADFVSKMSIALKEAAETKYWLKLLEQSEILMGIEYESLDKDCDEIVSLLVAIVKSTKTKNNS